MPLLDPPNKKPAPPPPPKKPPPSILTILWMAAAYYVILGVVFWHLVWRAWQRIEDGASMRDPDTAGRIAWGFGIFTVLAALAGVAVTYWAIKESRAHKRGGESQP